METRITDELTAMNAIKENFLTKSGWVLSYMTRRSIDAEETPLAWWSYPALTFLKERLNKSMTVFEYGCGYSTLWMAKKCSKVYSVESDAAWYERMKMVIPGNVEIIHRPQESFASEISTDERHAKAYDVVIIDGADRVNCAKQCEYGLKDDGVIIFDNCGTRWKEGFEYLMERGWRRIIFQGLAPICTYEVRTAILYRPNNCFKI